MVTQVWNDEGKRLRVFQELKEKGVKIRGEKAASDRNQ